MENRASYSVGNAVGENRFGILVTVYEANAAKRLALPFFDSDADVSESFDAVGHESFAARFVDWGHGTVGDSHGEALATGGDSSRKAGGASADYQDIYRVGETTRHKFEWTRSAITPLALKPNQFVALTRL